MGENSAVVGIYNSHTSSYSISKHRDARPNGMMSDKTLLSFIGLTCSLFYIF
ncbi:hypothetical protein SAMN05428978_10843 [Nitrosomonas sp. Nm34]|nr:hypothetical protein SAMN05428978_10843 [Nitrosomonas sp. Nm34]